MSTITRTLLDLPISFRHKKYQAFWYSKEIGQPTSQAIITDGAAIRKQEIQLKKNFDC